MLGALIDFINLCIALLNLLRTLNGGIYGP